jgi:hypothetical protein
MRYPRIWVDVMDGRFVEPHHILDAFSFSACAATGCTRLDRVMN